MTESEKSTQADWHDEDDAPDLSTPEWIEKFRSVPVRRGRPLIDTPKESTTIRLDADVLERFREGGPLADAHQRRAAGMAGQAGIGDSPNFRTAALYYRIRRTG